MIANSIQPGMKNVSIDGRIPDKGCQGDRDYLVMVMSEVGMLRMGVSNYLESKKQTLLLISYIILFFAS